MVYHTVMTKHDLDCSFWIYCLTHGRSSVHDLLSLTVVFLRLTCRDEHKLTRYSINNTTMTIIRSDKN